MRNADKQTDITKDSSKGKVTKHWRPCIDGFAPECPKRIKDMLIGLQKILGDKFKRDFPADLRITFSCNFCGKYK